MRVLLTGGSGFLGSHIADALSNRGHEVIILDTCPSPFLRDNQTFVQGSILEVDVVDRAIEGCDVVYHMAAISDIDAACLAPVETIRVNVLGTALLLEASRNADINRFIYASTVYVFSDFGSFYRTSKQASELLIEDYWERYALPFTILRFGSLYGPRADDRNGVYRMLKQAIEKQHIIYPGSGEELREYIHVLDAAESTTDILDEKFKNEKITLTGVEKMKSREMLEMIKEMMRNTVKIEFENKARPGHYVRTPYNYVPKLGKKLIRNTYVDLGQGLLDCMREIDEARNGET